MFDLCRPPTTTTTALKSAGTLQESWQNKATNHNFKWTK